MTPTSQPRVEPDQLFARVRSELDRADAASYVTSLHISRDDIRALLARAEAAEERERRLLTIEEDAKAETFQGHLMHRQWYSPREVWMLLRVLGATDDAIREALAEHHPEAGAQ